MYKVYHIDKQINLLKYINKVFVLYCFPPLMASTVHTNYPGVCLFTQNRFCRMRGIAPCVQAIF